MIRTLTIEQFRSFSRLEMHDLGRVNLIVGTNNSGKTATVQTLIFSWTNVVNRGKLILGAAGQRHKTGDTFRPAGAWLGPGTTAPATS